MAIHTLKRDATIANLKARIIKLIYLNSIQRSERVAIMFCACRNSY